MLAAGARRLSRSVVSAALVPARSPHLISFSTAAAAAEDGGGGGGSSYVSSPTIFKTEVLKHLKPRPGQTFLDTTFGVGGHTSLILDHCSGARVVAADRDITAYNAAMQMSQKYLSKSLLPLRSKFSQLPVKLRDIGITCGSLDGIIIDTGCSSFQWIDKSRGFCPLRGGRLDLRMDHPDETGETPTASEVLEVIEEKSLWLLLRQYGGMKQRAKYVATAIIEARYMFHQFETIQELREVINSAARRMSDNTGENAETLAVLMLEETVLALRMFVNDEINEMHFALGVVAEQFLKPGGALVAIVHSRHEEKVLFEVLVETANVGRKPGGGLNVRVTEEDVNAASCHPWRVESESAILVSEEERRLNPRLSSTRLLLARRTEWLRRQQEKGEEVEEKFNSERHASK